jgi:hypothetical protein
VVWYTGGNKKCMATGKGYPGREGAQCRLFKSASAGRRRVCGSNAESSLIGRRSLADEPVHS